VATGDIASHLVDIYGTDVSPELVSRVTDAVITDMAYWQSRLLDPRWLPASLGAPHGVSDVVSEAFGEAAGATRGLAVCCDPRDLALT
jgi:hypothetical protein